MKTLIAIFVLAATFVVAPSTAHAGKKEYLVPILGVSMGKEPVGVVTVIILSVERRPDESGFAIQFLSKPKGFSRLAQTAVEQAIRRVASVARISLNSWTVTVASLEYDVYGESLSAMTALSAVALMQGDDIRPDVFVTGAITPMGTIGAVGGVDKKILAAGEACHYYCRIIIPDDMDVEDRPYETPFLTQVTPTRSIIEAYGALTGEPLMKPNE